MSMLPDTIAHVRLSPCPICGGVSKLVNIDDVWFAKCAELKCNALGPVKTEPNTATASWNLYSTTRVGDIVHLKEEHDVALGFTSSLGIISRIMKIEGELTFEIAFLKPEPVNDYVGYLYYAKAEELTVVTPRPDRKSFAELLRPIQFSEFLSRLTKKYLRMPVVNQHHIRAVKRALMHAMKEDT